MNATSWEHLSTDRHGHIKIGGVLFYHLRIILSRFHAPWIAPLQLQMEERTWALARRLLLDRLLYRTHMHDGRVYD